MSGKILISGVTCIDIVNYAASFPEEDSDNRGLITLGGNAQNSATVLAQLNDHTEVFMALPSGNLLFDKHVHTPSLYSLVSCSLIVRSGVNVERCVYRESDDVPVSTVIVSMAKGSRTILHYEGNIEEPKAAEFAAQFPSFEGYSWVHFEAKAGRQFDELALMLEHVWNQRKAHQLPLKISVELEIRIPSEWVLRLLTYADVVFVSKDFAKAHGWKNAEKTVDQVQRVYRAENKLVICPWAEKGVTARESTKAKSVHVPAHVPPKVIDTLAAGDTFIATCLHFLNEGRDLPTVLRKAALLAGTKVGQKSVYDLPVELVLKD
ncbi:PfkB domain-containing protein [Aphelenchoides fujianensis]|nr:PfkB domain-containing protein [Aphelenchoides fujianensis]